ncbi:hypothetical protein Taro_049541 [Colocasia esculenta]|uniref:RRM domain-containing protein n=1 Tax=Colocasia esculenta TaxID=4460 RepID=A0A843XBA0_COLES|nr:hypothetical protein [Colocasia esculenta]
MAMHGVGTAMRRSETGARVLGRQCLGWRAKEGMFVEAHGDAQLGMAMRGAGTGACGERGWGWRVVARGERGWVWRRHRDEGSRREGMVMESRREGMVMESRREGMGMASTPSRVSGPSCLLPDDPRLAIGRRPSAPRRRRLLARWLAAAPAEMGAKAKKKVLQKKVKKATSALAISRRQDESSDFLPLEGGPGRKIPKSSESPEVTATVLYIGFFKQFGKIKRLRLARNRKTGKSKHYGFIEFENPEVVAKVVADEIHGYLLFEHQLQIYPIPPERVHPKLWKGISRRFKPLNWREIERKRHNKERTVEEHQRLVERILKRDEKCRKRIEAAGIDYDCPDFVVGSIQPKPKKIKFGDDE